MTPPLEVDSSATYTFYPPVRSLRSSLGPVTGSRHETKIFNEQIGLSALVAHSFGI